jgi:hypothetical protein
MFGALLEVYEADRGWLGKKGETLPIPRFGDHPIIGEENLPSTSIRGAPLDQALLKKFFSQGRTRVNWCKLLDTLALRHSCTNKGFRIKKQSNLPAGAGEIFPDTRNSGPRIETIPQRYWFVAGASATASAVDTRGRTANRRPRKEGT